MTSTRNPHEQRMGSLISMWKQAPLALMTMLRPLATFTVLHDPSYAAKADLVHKIVAHISNDGLAGTSR